MEPVRSTVSSTEPSAAQLAQAAAGQAQAAAAAAAQAQAAAPAQAAPAPPGDFFADSRDYAEQAQLNPVVPIPAAVDPGPTSAPEVILYDKDPKMKKYPQRRSGKKKIEKARREAAALALKEGRFTDDNEEDDEEDDDGAKESSRSSNKTFDPKVLWKNRFKRERAEDKLIEIGPIKVHQSVILTSAILIFLVGFPAIALVAQVSKGLIAWGEDSILKAAQKKQAEPKADGSTAIPSTKANLIGQWELIYQNPSGSIGRGFFSLTQKNDSFEGWGNDNSGQFQISGTVKGEEIGFKKSYIKDGKFIENAVYYTGKISEKSKNKLQMVGVWKVTKKEGPSEWRGKMVTYSGPFEAVMKAAGQENVDQAR